MASFAKELLELIGALEGLRLSIYMDTASCAIYVYDYMLTFEDERTLIWPKKLSITNVLFFMVRYLPIIDLSITATHHFRTDLSPETCSFAFKSAAWLINIGVVTAELILLIRTYTIWTGYRIARVALVAWGIANLVADVLVMEFFLKSIGFSALPPGLSGCLVTSGNSLLLWVWIILMVYESFIIVLLALKGIAIYREQGTAMGNSSLYVALFQDGAIFYVYIFALSVANVLVISTLSRDKSKLGMLASIERVTHSVLTGRLLLTLRKSNSKSTRDEETEEEELQSIQFADPPRRAVNSEAETGSFMASLASGQGNENGASASMSFSAAAAAGA